MALRAAFLLFAILGSTNASQGSPVTKVVELIKEMKGKIEADGKMEQKIYDKYACWCETTSLRKANDIHQAMADIKSLGTSILEYKGRVATLSSEISELTREARDNQKAVDDATGIRQRENGEFMGQKAEYEQTLNALERGIKVLMGAGTGGDVSFVQSSPKDDMSLLGVAKDVHEALQLLPVDHLLSPAALAQVSAFTESPEYYDQKAKKSASFSPASATIQGILKDMYDTFAMNLEKGTENEATQQKNYENLMATKNKEMATLVSTRKSKEDLKAEAEKNLADTSEQLDDTTIQMKADSSFFDTTKAACTAKAAEWNERVRARSEELAGINKGLEILTSDDARALFSKSIKPGTEKLFLQTETESVVNSVYAVLKKHATKVKSLRLAQLAATLKTGGHFDSVIAEIDKMIENLREEEQDDITQRDWCKEETFKNEQEAARHEYKIEKLVTKVMKLTKKLEDLEVTRANVIQQIEDTQDDIAEMESARIAEHNAFEGAKSDDEGCVQLLTSAIEVMSAFYNNNKIDMGEIQGAANALVQEPVFERSEDAAPDATFTSAGKSSGESKGIISIMTMINEDLQDEISNGVKNEKQAQADFEKQLESAHKLVDDLTTKKTNLETSISDTNTEITETNIEKESTQGLLDEDRAYLAGIKPDCDWMLGAFENRRDARATEVEGLEEAKGMLSGAAPPSLLETRKKGFDDADFSKLSFRGLAARR